MPASQPVEVSGSRSGLPTNWSGKKPKRSMKVGAFWPVPKAGVQAGPGAFGGPGRRGAEGADVIEVAVVVVAAAQRKRRVLEGAEEQLPARPQCCPGPGPGWGQILAGIVRIDDADVAPLAEFLLFMVERQRHRIARSSPAARGVNCQVVW